MASKKEYSAVEVAEAFKANDSFVLSQIYHCNYPSVEKYILQNSGTSDDARDVFQEAMLALWQAMCKGTFQLQAGANVGGFLFQVAKFKWLDKLRSKEHKSTLRLHVEKVEFATDDEKPWWDAESRHAQLATYFDKLGEQCKIILRRFYYEKQSLEQIGEELNYDAATMRTKKYRCMMQLRKMHDTD